MSEQIISVNCGFFDSIDGDRLYTAEKMNEPYSHFISDGIFATPTGKVISGTTNYINQLSGPNMKISDPVDARVQGLNIYGKTITPEKYRVRIKKENESEYTTAADDITDTEYTVLHCENETKYNILIDVYDHGQWYENKNPIIATTHGENANAPVVRAIARDGQIQLFWDAITGADKYYISQMLDGGGYVALESAYRGTSYLVSGLENGKTYTFWVQAHVGSTWYPKGASAVYWYASATPHPADSCEPTGATAVPYSNQIDLEWTFRTIGEYPITVTIDTDGASTGILEIGNIAIRGIPASVDSDYTYIDERGNAWIADELDFAAGIMISRLDSNFQPITPTTQPLSAQLITSYKRFRTGSGLMAYIQNNIGAYMDIDFVQSVIQEKAMNDLAGVEAFKVSAASGSLNIYVNPGRGLFAQKWYENPTSISFQIPANVTINPRIDSVVIQVDERESGRVGNLVYRTGLAAREPEPPAVGTLSQVTEYRIANILVNPGVTEIAEGMITDLRGTEECPWAASQIFQGNIAALTGRILAAESTVTSMQTDLGAAESDIAQIKSTITDIETDVSDLFDATSDSRWITLSSMTATAGDPAPRVRKIGKQVFLIGQFASGNSASGYPTGQLTVLSSEFRPPWEYVFPAKATGIKSGIHYPGIALVKAGTDGIMLVESCMWFDGVEGPFQGGTILINTSYSV